MEDKKKMYLFEEAVIPKAVMSMAVPTVISSLVMVIYNLADTYFVGMLNNPIQNAAFNAINNLFGVGSSSMMSRALGAKDYDTVRKVSVFGFYCTVFGSFLFSLLCTVAKNPLLAMLGTDAETYAATGEYACHPQCSDGIHGAVRGQHAACQHRDNERLCSEYYFGSDFHFAAGTGYGGCRGRAGHVPF